MCGALNKSAPWGETAQWFMGRVLGCGRSMCLPSGEAGTVSCDEPIKNGSRISVPSEDSGCDSGAPIQTESPLLLPCPHSTRGLSPSLHPIHVFVLFCFFASWPSLQCVTMLFTVAVQEIPKSAQGRGQSWHFPTACALLYFCFLQGCERQQERELFV